MEEIKGEKSSLRQKSATFGVNPLVAKSARLVFSSSYTPRLRPMSSGDMKHRLRLESGLLIAVSRVGRAAGLKVPREGPVLSHWSFGILMPRGYSL